MPEHLPNHPQGLHSERRDVMQASASARESGPCQLRFLPLPQRSEKDRRTALLLLKPCCRRRGLGKRTAFVSSSPDTSGETLSWFSLFSSFTTNFTVAPEKLTEFSWMLFRSNSSGDWWRRRMADEEMICEAISRGGQRQPEENPEAVPKPAFQTVYAGRSELYAF